VVLLVVAVVGFIQTITNTQVLMEVM
jgi:hypothetical protein